MTASCTARSGARDRAASITTSRAGSGAGREAASALGDEVVEGAGAGGADGVGGAGEVDGSGRAGGGARAEGCACAAADPAADPTVNAKTAARTTAAVREGGRTGISRMGICRRGVERKRARERVVRWPLRRQVAPSSSGGPFAARDGWSQPSSAAASRSRCREAVTERRLPRGGCREAVAERRLPRGGPRGACGGAWAVDVGLTVGTTADTPEAASTNGGSRSSNPPHEQIGASSTKTRGSSKPQAFVPLYGRLADGGRGSVEGIRGRSRRRPIVEPFDAPTLLPLPP